MRFSRCLRQLLSRRQPPQAGHLMHIPASFAFLVIAAEIFGSLGILLGLLTRIAAFGIAVTMAVAISIRAWFVDAVDRQA